jgi:hypothetical protein
MKSSGIENTFVKTKPSGAMRKVPNSVYHSLPSIKKVKFSPLQALEALRVVRG